MTRPLSLRWLAPGLFVVSGAAGLLLQVAWFRLLALGLGSTLLAATVDLAAFMAGLALGGWLYARRSDRIRSPLRAFGLLELGAGACSLATLPLLLHSGAVLAWLARPFPDSPSLVLAMKIALALVALLPATTLMGATLPALCAALVRDSGEAGTRTGSLYALNTLGAVAGTLVALFVVLPRWGLVVAVVIAGSLDLAVGLLVLAAGGRRPATPGEIVSVDTITEPHGAPAGMRFLSVVLAITGAAGLAYEVLWTRALSFYFGSGAHAFALMLAVVLAGLALGGFLGGALADRVKQPILVLAGSQSLLGLAVAHQIMRFPELPDFLYQLALRFEGGISMTRLSWLFLLGAVQVLLPASLLMGAALPSAVRCLGCSGPAAGRVVGRLASANALGTIAGAVLGAWVLVPLLGLQRALLAVAAIGALVAMASSVRFATGRPRTMTIALAAVSLGVVVLTAVLVHPHRVYAGSGVFEEAGGGRSLLHVGESAHGTVALSRIVDDRGTWLSLSVDAVNVAGTSGPLLDCQLLQGHLPMLLAPERARVLHVGFGSGGTAAAVARHAAAREIHAVEINPAILETSDRLLREVNEGVLDDPRVVRHLDDGRNHLLLSREPFDIILSDSIHPRYRGNSTLYTVEYFELCRRRLAPGGLVSTWLPIYSLSSDSLRSIIASMRSVFPSTSVWYLNSTVNEFVVLIGRTEGGGIDHARMRERLEEPAVAASLERIGVRSPEDVLDFFVAEGASLDTYLGDVKLHHDAHPWVEMESAAVMDRDGSWLLNLSGVLGARTSVIPLLANASADDVTNMERRELATTSALAGHLQWLRHDIPGARASVARALAIAPEDREPWEIAGVPPWVLGFVAGGAAPAEDGAHEGKSR